MVVQTIEDFYSYFGVNEYDLYAADMLGIIPTPGVMPSEQSRQEIDEILLGMQELNGIGTPVCALFQDVDDYYMVIPYMYYLNDNRQLDALKKKHEFIAFVCGGYGHSAGRDGFKLCSIDRNNKIHILKDRKSDSLQLINSLYYHGRERMHSRLGVPEAKRDEYLYDDLVYLVSKKLEEGKVKANNGIIRISLE